MKYKYHLWACIMAVVMSCTACQKAKTDDEINNSNNQSQEMPTKEQESFAEKPNKSEISMNALEELEQPVDISDGTIDENPFVIDPVEEIESIAEQIPQNTSGSAIQSASSTSIFANNSKAYIDDEGSTVGIRVHNNSITITDVIDCKSNKITIPAFIDQMPVVSIGSNAFENADVVSVEISEGITTIESQAFYGNTTIKKISIPKSISSIGSNAFGNCSSLEEFELSDQNKNYCLSNGVLYNKQKTSLIRYPAAKEDKTYQIEKGVVTIEAGAFSMSSKIEKVTFPDSLRSIETEAFAGCVSLDIDLPDKIIELESFAFADCCSLSKIVVPKQIEEIAEGTFSGCENAVSIKFVGKVKEIGYSAFANCTSVSKIEFQDSVSKIGEMSFAFCSSLKNITLPEGTKEIADMAFYFCNSLESITIPKTVTYLGSMIFDEDISLRIYTPKGSAAENYAVSNGIACEQQ
ncbi:MAG: leucine-rich repeat domain-containing protein [Clostridiales bacterium]|nr:leucine-rich repeat domain-containing protein [Clostridiales bacterium]